MREDAEKRARLWLVEARQEIIGDGQYTRAVSEMTGLPLTDVVQAVDWALTEAAPTVKHVADRFYDCVQPLTSGNEISDELHEEISTHISGTMTQLWAEYTNRIAEHITTWAERRCLGEDGIN